MRAAGIPRVLPPTGGFLRCIGDGASVTRSAHWINEGDIREHALGTGDFCHTIYTEDDAICIRSVLPVRNRKWITLTRFAPVRNRKWITLARFAPVRNRKMDSAFAPHRVMSV